MALIQRSHSLRSRTDMPSVTPLRFVVRAAGLTPLRRCSTSAVAVPSTNQLSPVAMPPIGYGPTIPSPGQDARQRVIMRSFLGVGAPEALLVAVVALVVFGPKGLADAAKSVGKTLRTFQPTIREVVDASNEIRGTLEQELGLDEFRQATSLRPTPRPIRTDSSSSDSATPSTSSPSSTSSGLQPINEDQAKQIDPDIELKRAMSEQAAWRDQALAAVPASTAAAEEQAAAARSQNRTGEGQAAAVPQPSKDLSALSLEDLQAELARRSKSA